MYKDDSQTFGIVCLENLDHKLYRSVILGAESTKTRRSERYQYTIFAMEKSVISKTIA